MLPNPRPPRMFSFHPLHTYTKKFPQMCLTFSPQYTYYQTTYNDQRTQVDEHALFPTVSWTSYYHFSNPLSIPFYINPDDNELCHTRLHHLTAALHEKQFTTIGLTQTLNRFITQKANRFSINHYDHAIARYMENTFLGDDTNANPQLTENFFLISLYVFVINCMNKKFDHIFFTELRDTKTSDPYFNKFNHFSLNFIFLSPKERDLHCSHQLKLRTKQTHTYTYYKFIQHHYTTNTPSQNPQHRFQFINSKLSSPFFINFTLYIRDTKFAPRNEQQRK